MTTDVTVAVQQFLTERSRLGVRRYGTPLTSHNGRDALRDALEEAADCLMYLTQHEWEETDRHGLGSVTVLPLAARVVAGWWPPEPTSLSRAVELVHAIAQAVIGRDGHLPCGDSDPQPEPTTRG